MLNPYLIQVAWRSAEFAWMTVVTGNAPNFELAPTVTYLPRSLWKPSNAWRSVGSFAIVRGKLDSQG